MSLGDVLDCRLNQPASTLKSTLQALKPWESISPYQAIVDEVKFVDCLETQLRVLGECNFHHVVSIGGDFRVLVFKHSYT